jgi:hypothetical protein
MAVADAVEMVHNNHILKKFWRKGQLVVNNIGQHPYQTNIPGGYKKVDRWFMLDTELDPLRPWALKSELPVFSLAMVIGEPPEREWLIYAHSPIKDRQGVRISIPGYGQIIMDVKTAGNFCHILEKNKEVNQIF